MTRLRRKRARGSVAPGHDQNEITFGGDKGDVMDLEGKRVAVLVEDRYADLELWYPALRLQEAGADVTIVGTETGRYTSKYGLPINADISAEEVEVDAFEAVIIPGGAAPDAIRCDPAMVAFVHDMEQAGKIVAAVSYAGQALTSAHNEHDAYTVRFFGLKAHAIQTEGPFAKSAVIRQGNLITARPPVDLLAFCRMIMDALIAAESNPSARMKDYG